MKPAPPPANAHILDETGRPNQAWVEWFQNLSKNQLGISQAQADAIAAQAGADAAQASADTAGAGATAAATAAATALAQIAAIYASPPIWVIGDYRQTALATLGSKWLLCDGSTKNTSDYPDLSGVLLSITGPGGTSGTFKLPGIAAVYGPGSTTAPVMQTFIKALGG